MPTLRELKEWLRDLSGTEVNGTVTASATYFAPGDTMGAHTDTEVQDINGRFGLLAPPLTPLLTLFYPRFRSFPILFYPSSTITFATLIVFMNAPRSPPPHTHT